jgi:hypothetical protein
LFFLTLQLIRNLLIRPNPLVTIIFFGQKSSAIIFHEMERQTWIIHKSKSWEGNYTELNFHAPFNISFSFFSLVVSFKRQVFSTDWIFYVSGTLIKKVSVCRFLFLNSCKSSKRFTSKITKYRILSNTRFILINNNCLKKGL